MVIGVRGMPFAAHAWVEVQGAVVEGEGLCSNFTILHRIGDRKG
jgi:hypothetical protein